MPAVTVYVLAEGQTEETFVDDVLAPTLWENDVYLRPILAATKRVKHGPVYRGGVVRYAPFRREALLLLRHQDAHVTTMIDLYGLPDDFPGRDNMPPHGTCYDRVAHLEAALAADIGNVRFVPYISLHEFESFAYVKPDVTAEVVSEDGAAATRVAKALQAIRDGFDGPEHINEGTTTAPSKRLLKVAEGYRKTVHGPLLTSRVGLVQLRTDCPHFDKWLTTLEGIGGV
jgi:uncharacterized protein DUF4276